MFDPMWDPPDPTLFGIPILYLVIAVGLVGAVTGLLWMRRIVGGEPETESFLATADRRLQPNNPTIVGIGLLGLALIAGGLLIHGAAGPGDASRLPVDVNQLALWLGIVLDILAAVLFVRRVLVR